MSSSIPPTMRHAASVALSPSLSGEYDTQVLSASECVPSPPDRSLESEFPRVRGYEILSIIGSGGMGIVYKAKQRDLQRIVALKMLHHGSMSDVESRRRFQAEAEAVARLQHPNIIQVFEIGKVMGLPGEVHPSPFIALEFIDGGSLERCTTAPQSPRFVARIVEKLARAAHAAHLLGVVHRDLKPANVLLTADGEPKLADFGIAKHIGTGNGSPGPNLTMAGMAMGTPEYMAPEQVAGENATPAVDVYALGVILYQLLTARVPFQGATPTDTMYLVRSEEPVSPRRLQPGLSRDLETICLKCLSKAPGRRYETAESLADDLARWLEGRPIHARPVDPIERLLRWTRRNPTEASLWAAVVLVALAGVAGVVWKWRDAERLAQAATTAAYRSSALAKSERWERYRANIAAASGALQLHDAVTARQALLAAPEEHRNWEWKYFSRQVDTAQHTLRSDGNLVHWLVMSPDGAAVSSVTEDNVARFWDVKGRRNLGVIPNAEAFGRSTMSPRGDTLCYLPNPPAYDCVNLHDIAAFKTRAVLRGHGVRVCGTSYSTDGRRLAVSDVGGSVIIYDVASGNAIREFKAHDSPCGGSRFSQDGRLLGTTGTSDHTARVWDVETGKLLLDLPNCPGRVDSVMFNAAGDRLLVRSARPIERMWLHEYPSGRLLAEMTGHSNHFLWYGFSPDGNRIATASLDQTIRLWDGRDGKLIAVLRGHTGVVNQATFSPDGTRLASASQDRTVRLWDAGLGQELAVLHGHEAEVFAVEYTPDGRTLTSGSRDGTVKLWDAHEAEFGPTLRGHTRYVYGVAFHPDGRRVASSGWDGTARVWDADTGRQLLTLNLGDAPDTVVASVAFHPQGKLLATVCRDDTVRLWDVDSGREEFRWEVPTKYWLDTRLAFSPNGELLAVGDLKGVVWLLDVANRSVAARLTSHRGIVRDVAFSPDGRTLASGGEDHTIRIWNVETRQCERVLEDHAEKVYALAFNRSGSLLASGSTDGTIRLWESSNWTRAAVLTPNTGVYSLAFTPDGTRLASACTDNTIRFWDVATRQEMGELRGHQGYVHAIAFSPDGSRLVSGSGDFTVRLWDTLDRRVK